MSAVKKTRVQADNFSFWVLGRQFYKFLGGVFSGNTRKKCAGVYKGIPMVYFGGYMYCTHNMFTVLFFNGSCTSNMFMVLQVVALWLYTSYKYCVIIFDHKNIFEYKNIFYSGMGWAGLTSTLCVCIVLL